VGAEELLFKAFHVASLEVGVGVNVSHWLGSRES
jgi:hypothetical protein